MIKKKITKIFIQKKVDNFGYTDTTMIVNYNLIIFGFIHIPMASGGILFDGEDGFSGSFSNSDEIFSIAKEIIS